MHATRILLASNEYENDDEEEENNPTMLLSMGDGETRPISSSSSSPRGKIIPTPLPSSHVVATELPTNNLRRGLSHVQVAVVSHKQVRAANMLGLRHTRYVITVRTNQRAWEIERRYYEFKRLRDGLYSIGFPCPHLPPRRFWERPRTETELQRKTESLDLWLHGTMAVWQSMFMDSSSSSRDDTTNHTTNGGADESVNLLMEFLCSSKLYKGTGLSTSLSYPPSLPLHSNHDGDHDTSNNIDHHQTWFARRKFFTRNAMSKLSTRLNVTWFSRHRFYPSTNTATTTSIPPSAVPILVTTDTSVHSRTSSSHADGNNVESTPTRVMSMTDNDGTQLRWVFSSTTKSSSPSSSLLPRITASEQPNMHRVVTSHHRRRRHHDEDQHDDDTLFHGAVVQYVELEPCTDFEYQCEFPLRADAGMTLDRPFRVVLKTHSTVPRARTQPGLYNAVSVPNSPTGRRRFIQSWNGYTDKLLTHTEKRLAQRTLMATKASQPPQPVRGDNSAIWVDTDSEGGGSEEGSEFGGIDVAFAERRAWLFGGDDNIVPSPPLLLTTDVDGKQVNNEDGGGGGYDSEGSEGWASEAAMGSFDGGGDLVETNGSWEKGNIWVGPKRAPRLQQHDGDDDDDEQDSDTSEEEENNDDDSDDDDSNDDDDDATDNNSAHW